MTVRSNASDYQNVLVSLVHDECELIEEDGPSFRRTVDLEQGSFRRMLEADGVTAIARCAVRRKGDLVGFVGIDFLHRLDKAPERIEELPIFVARIEQVLTAGK